MLELLAFLGTCGLMFVPFVAIFGLAFAWGHWQGRRWETAAAQLGLQLDPPPQMHALARIFGGANAQLRRSMRGTRAGLPVEVGMRIVVTGSGKNRNTTYYTYARASFPKPLGIGLGIHPVGILGRAFKSLVGEGDIQVGHPTLDPAYDLRAAEPEMVQALVRVPYVEEALVWNASATFRPFVDDTSVRCERQGKALDAPSLAVALDAAVDLARRIAAGRAQIGASSAERVVAEQWRSVASARGLALDVDGMCMSGRVEGVHVEVEAPLRGTARYTVFTVRFDHALGLGLALTRQTGVSTIGKLLGMQDIEVGDPMFDGRFVVKGAPVDAVRAVLTPEVRARLVELQSQASRLVIEDDHLSAEVGWLVADPSWVDSGILAVARAGAALLQVEAAGAGPYRR